MGAWLASVTSGLISKPEAPPATKLATCAHCGRDDVRVPATTTGTVFCSGDCAWAFKDSEA